MMFRRPSGLGLETGDMETIQKTLGLSFDAAHDNLLRDRYV